MTGVWGLRLTSERPAGRMTSASRHLYGRAFRLNFSFCDDEPYPGHPREATRRGRQTPSKGNSFDTLSEKRPSMLAQRTIPICTSKVTVDFLRYIYNFCCIPSPHSLIPGVFPPMLRGQDVCIVRISDEGTSFCCASTSENPLVSG